MADSAGFRLADQEYDPAIPVGAVSEHPDNPNQGDTDLLDEMLDEFGFMGAIIVQKSTGYIVSGNHRHREAVAKGATTLPGFIVDLDDVQAAKWMAGDNESTRRGRNDLAKLVALLRPVKDLRGSGFTFADRERLVGLLRKSETANGDGEPGEADSFAVFPAEQVQESAFEFFRRAGFPYRDVPPHECMQAINRLARTPDETLPQTITGYHVADMFHPYRFSVECTDSDGSILKTPVQAFASDRLLKCAIGLAMERGGPLTGTSLVSTLVLVSGTRGAANFRPGFALLMYRRYCPDGGTVLDCSAGFGGRLVGFLASTGGLYIGIDPLTCPGNQALADALGVAGRVELHALPAEDVVPELVAGRCDFAFTSPPYFGKERYADDETQSWKRYPTGEAWRAGFLEPVMRLQYAALKNGATAAVNIADVTMRKEVVPLEQWTVDAGVAAGFSYLGRDVFPLGHMMGQGEALDEPRSEPVFMFRKEG